MWPWILALILVLPAAQGEDEGFVDEGQGFRIRVPAAQWVRVERAPAPDTRHTVDFVRTGGDGAIRVTLFVAELPLPVDSEAACDGAESLARANELIGDLARGQGELAGEPAPWLRFTYRADVPYTVRILYRTHGDALFALQCAAPSERFEAAQGEFAAFVQGFELLATSDVDLRRDQELLRRLAARCGSEVAWARDWEEASARAREEAKPVLAVVERYRGLPLATFAHSTLFMDTELVELVQERFVPLHLTQASGAPFEDPAAYGLGPHTFGQAVLFVDAGGRILAEAVSLDPIHVYDVARAVLREHAQERPGKGRDAAESLRRGDLERAVELLKSPRSPSEWLEKAALLRRQRQGTEALAALARARSGGVGDLEGLELEEGRIRVRMGDFAGAEALLATRSEPEAVYWRIVARCMQIGLEAVRGEVLQLARSHPDDRWAWRAAALLVGQGMATGIDRAAWHAEERLSAARVVPFAPLRDARRAEHDALAFLLRTQLPDGSWPVPLALPAPTGPTAVAATAVVGFALLAHRDRPGVPAALERAFEFVVEHLPGARSEALFDQGVWGQTFSLRFLAACAELRFGERERVGAAMQDLVDELARGRLPDGGWAYFRLEGSEGVAISFVTAVVVCALLEARAAGARVEDGLIGSGADLVAAARRVPGEYRYFGPSAPQILPEAEAAFRGPLCALALERAGRGSPEEIQAALDLYLSHRGQGLAERGKTLCHTSPAGLASYYLLFGCAFAAEALERLPLRARARYRAALLEDVLALRTADGGFCDSPILGRHYGAGMALRALLELRR